MTKNWGSQNRTAKNNIAWVADIIEIELNENKKFYICLCIDIHTNKIIAKTASQRVIKAQSIVRCLKKDIDKRFLVVPKTKTILHTDRGTQFSSECYNKFAEQFERFIEPSMSIENTTTDNAVAELLCVLLKNIKLMKK